MEQCQALYNQSTSLLHGTGMAYTRSLATKPAPMKLFLLARKRGLLEFLTLHCRKSQNLFALVRKKVS